MKFTMFEKETKDEKHRKNPYRAINFTKDEKRKIICPKGRKFNFKYKQDIKEQLKLNRELTTIHEEVLRNLCSIQGALLCMNRSIQAEGTFGIIKSDKSYKRLRRKGIENVILEFTLISCGFNLYKYHKKMCLKLFIKSIYINQI